MSVLYVPVVPPPPPSRQARELAEQIEKVISDYEVAHPSVSARDIRYALMLAQRRSGRLSGSRALVVGLSVTLAVGAAAFALSRSGGIHPSGGAPVLIVAVLVAVVAVIVGLARRQP